LLIGNRGGAPQSKLSSSDAKMRMPARIFRLLVSTLKGPRATGKISQCSRRALSSQGAQCVPVFFCEEQPTCPACVSFRFLRVRLVSHHLYNSSRTTCLTIPALQNVCTHLAKLTTHRLNSRNTIASPQQSARTTHWCQISE
jgi:hypothetical protein